MCKFISFQNGILDGIISFEFHSDVHSNVQNMYSRNVKVHSFHQNLHKDNLNDSVSELNHRKNNEKICSYLREIIRSDKDGDNLLMIAIILRKTKLAMLLIGLVPDYRWLSRTNRNFQTVLHLATLTGDCEVVRRLIVAGVKIHKRDWRGNTALHIACRLGLLDVAEVLLKPVTFIETQLNVYDIPYQAIPQDLEIRNSDGLTCLLIAATKRNKEIMNLLINNEADINSFDMKSGKTCLHYFAENGDKDLMKFVLSKTRVDVNARDYSGFTALQIARLRGHDQIAYLLRLEGADESLSDNEYISN